MSYHSDHHWFDFDDHHLDMMYPMTDLDKQIAKYGAEAVLNKGKKPNTHKPKNKPHEEVPRNQPTLQVKSPQ